MHMVVAPCYALRLPFSRAILATLWNLQCMKRAHRRDKYGVPVDKKSEAACENCLTAADKERQAARKGRKKR